VEGLDKPSGYSSGSRVAESKSGHGRAGVQELRVKTREVPTNRNDWSIVR
jgi:hypothetical protein